MSAEDEGATPVKRRRVSSDDDRAGESTAPLCVASSSSALPSCSDQKPDHQEALTPASTSDTETRDSSSLIDPGTEQDPPTPDPAPSSSGNLDSSPKEEKMEASSSSSSSFSSSSSLLQEAGEGFAQGEEPEPQRHVAASEEEAEPRESRRGEASSAASEEVKEEKEAGSKNSSATPLSEDAAFPSALGLVGEGPEGCSSHAPSAQAFPSTGPPPDMLDMLYRTVEATIAIVTKLSVKGPPSS
ncbi:ubiquitin carboxyl-terminal hydrolase 34-like [Notolabrus celidotus]|uniref:ubiquitin carboxyl-terminal hydrolase 34-like n=1 Tax=Notolabrus celidotus TaxID=1203425 RepID=UPI00148F7513|nr:ubiquitin carboxyl-terminal hydrolase 34-like [Notolabrus celidotus]